MKSNRSIERAVDVLLAFSRAEPSIEVSALARRLRLSRATLYRILYTLEKKGLVRSHGEPLRFELSEAVGAIADAWSGRTPLLEICKPHLDALVVKTRETVAIMVPASETTRTCVYEQRGAHPLSFSAGVGYSERLLLGASSKAMLAFFDEDRLALALRGVPLRVRKSLMTELGEVRKQGYAHTAGEMVPGAAAIAAPIFDEAKEVVASVCLFGAAARFEGSTLSGYIRNLTSSAGLCSAAFAQRKFSPGTRA